MTNDSETSRPLERRLIDLGLRDPRHRTLFLERLRQQRRADEGLEEAYGRCLCRWLEDAGGWALPRGTIGLAVAEATVALSGLAERWPRYLLQDEMALPPVARARLTSTLPLATPQAVLREMPAQSLEPIGLSTLLPVPRRRATGPRPALASAAVKA